MPRPVCNVRGQPRSYPMHLTPLPVLVGDGPIQWLLPVLLSCVWAWPVGQGLATRLPLAVSHPKSGSRKGTRFPCSRRGAAAPSCPILLVLHNNNLWHIKPTTHWFATLNFIHTFIKMHTLIPRLCPWLHSSISLFEWANGKPKPESLPLILVDLWKDSQFLLSRS